MSTPPTILLAPITLDTTEAACIGHDPELWFPSDLAQAAKAKLVCKGCPIRTACADQAIRAGIPFGIWGGTWPGQRERARR